MHHHIWAGHSSFPNTTHAMSALMSARGREGGNMQLMSGYFTPFACNDRITTANISDGAATTLQVGHNEAYTFPNTLLTTSCLHILETASPKVM
mmetsp:Transcript_107405/g.185283  ORF Transcript_107405/g.185283 Transcript_107405/m.185283 type:complete len:94 (+) Transcript_107405:111-392(+)